MVGGHVLVLVGVVVWREDRLSGGRDFEFGQDEQGTQERDGSEDAPVLEMREGVLADRTNGRDQLVDLFLRRGEGLARAAF